MVRFVFVLLLVCGLGWSAAAQDVDQGALSAEQEAVLEEAARLNSEAVALYRAGRLDDALALADGRGDPRAPLLKAGQPYVPKSLDVIDGDTLKVDGINVRITNLDTPERGGRAECDAERYLAAIATRYAEELVLTPILIIPEGREDYFRRPLVRVTAGGKDWGQLMVEGNMAVPWAGHTHDWCGR
jgi:micrococcal nuclease